MGSTRDEVAHSVDEMDARHDPLRTVITIDNGPDMVWFGSQNKLEVLAKRPQAKATPNVAT